MVLTGENRNRALVEWYWQEKNEYRALVEWYWQEKTEIEHWWNDTDRRKMNIEHWWKDTDRRKQSTYVAAPLWPQHLVLALRKTCSLHYRVQSFNSLYAVLFLRYRRFGWTGYLHFHSFAVQTDSRFIRKAGTYLSQYIVSHHRKPHIWYTPSRYPVISQYIVSDHKRPHIWYTPSRYPVISQTANSVYQLCGLLWWTQCTVINRYRRFGWTCCLSVSKGMQMEVLGSS